EDQRQETPAGRGPRGVRARIAAVHLLARGVHLELGPVLAPADHGPESLVGRGLGLGPLERDGERGLRRDPERERAPVRQRLAVDPVAERDDRATLLADAEGVDAAVRSAVVAGGPERPALAVDREGDEIPAARVHNAPSRGSVSIEESSGSIVESPPRRQPGPAPGDGPRAPTAGAPDDRREIVAS